MLQTSFRSYLIINQVLAYCALTQREVEVLPLSRDTTESDLKQRREMQQGTSHFVDQAPVLHTRPPPVITLDNSCNYALCTYVLYAVCMTLSFAAMCMGTWMWI